jgi:hypothetical protein
MGLDDATAVVAVGTLGFGILMKKLRRSLVISVNAFTLH